MPNSPSAKEVSPQELPSHQVQEIYGRFGRDLWAFLLGVLKDRNAAEDALQQTFQRLAEFGQTARSDTVRGWLFQVAFREAMLIRRRQDRDGRHYEGWWLAIGRNRSQAAPDEQLISKEQQSRLGRAVEQLPEEQRIVVERRIHHHETFAEISARLDVPLGTVLTRMRIAMQSLRKALYED